MCIDFACFTLAPLVAPAPLYIMCPQALTGGERVELRTPVREAGYTTHPGAVFGMDCSPFQV